MNEQYSENSDEEVSAETEGKKYLQPENSLLSQQLPTSVEFTGPIPPPGILEQYNRIFPDAANRFISMAERDQEHRHKMHEKLVDAQIIDNKQERTERRLRQIFGLTVGVVSIMAGSVTAIFDASIAGSIAGGVLGSAGVAGWLVSIYVLDRREQQKAQTQLESSIEDQPSST